MLKLGTSRPDPQVLRRPRFAQACLRAQKNTEQTSTNVRSRFPIFKLVLHSNFLRVCLSFGHESENTEKKESDLVKMAYINNAGDNLNHTLDKPKLHLHTITWTHVIPLMMNSPISAPLKRSNTTHRTRVGRNPSQISVVEKHLLCDMCPNFCTVRTHSLSYGNHSILFLAEWGATLAECLVKVGPHRKQCCGWRVR